MNAAELSAQKVKSIYKVTDTQILGFFNEHRFLSNFHIQRVMYNGVVYPHNEAAYQAQKTLDAAKRLELFTDCTPSEARKRGRLLPLREDWLKYLPSEDLVTDSEGVLILQARDKIMYEINCKKFYRNIDLMDKLLATGDKYLEETNWWRDDYWGVFNGTGLNKLGRILMKIRKDAKEIKQASQ
jgi:predicted NAD-dependent protein-ADP-ribosyltransferase YbiA (DUF1768 family)